MTGVVYHNVLEPQAFTALFSAYPPIDFICPPSSLGLPSFQTEFDLFTTLDNDSRRMVQRLPFYSCWGKKLSFPTRFAGTTITEYLPLPGSSSPQDILQHVLEEFAPKQALTILKDLPQDSPLLSQEANAFNNELVAHARQKGFIEVQGQALAYVPINFSTLDEYMGRLSASRRKDMRRKMRSRSKLAIEVLPLGDRAFFDHDFMNDLYAMYREVFDQSEIHFDLLSRDFFTALLQSKQIQGVVLCYVHEGMVAGYNICLIHKGMLIDKYIGFKYPLARDLNLYFLSWMINLEFALEHKLHTYIAGWTDPEVKASLGAQFTFTRHLVWVRNPLLRRVLMPLRHCFESDSQKMRQIP